LKKTQQKQATPKTRGLKASWVSQYKQEPREGKRLAKLKNYIRKASKSSRMNLSINIAMISITQSSLLLLHALHCSAPSEWVDNLDWVVMNQSVKVLVDVGKLESFSKQTLTFSMFCMGRANIKANVHNYTAIDQNTQA